MIYKTIVNHNFQFCSPSSEQKLAFLEHIFYVLHFIGSTKQINRLAGGRFRDKKYLLLNCDLCLKVGPKETVEAEIYQTWNFLLISLQLLLIAVAILKPLAILIALSEIINILWREVDVKYIGVSPIKYIE